MSPFAIALLSLSMSADAFAASIARGAQTRPNFAGAVRGGLVFGGIEAVTPVLGWAVGLVAAGFIGSISHWIAFLLLGGVGGRMIWEAVRRSEEDEAPPPSRGRSILGLVLTAVGTSIDAAAVGVSLALVGVNIVAIALSIGFATFVMATIGLTLGSRAGHLLGPIAEILGGVALIVIGTVILLEHLGMFG